MAEKENCVRLTRAAKKRATAWQSLQQDPPRPDSKKKRVALRELSNISDLIQKPVSRIEPSKQKCRSKKEQKPEVADIDANVDDTQLCAPYASDIYKYLHFMEMESKRRPLLNYIDLVQSDVTPNMRGILVDWLVEVADEYKLVSDTLYLTVSYIDRFLSSSSIKRHRLQLLGVSCMLIASKYEEISPPHVEDFCYITDNTYTKEEMVKMETEVLKFMRYEMGNPTIKTFLRRFVRAALEDCKSPNVHFEFLANYLAELSLLDYSCVWFLPSVVAASVVFVSRLTIHPKMHPWTLTLQHHTGYRPCQLKECIHAIHELQMSRRGCNLFAIRLKYKQHKFKSVAALSPPLEIPAIYFEDVKA